MRTTGFVMLAAMNLAHMPLRHGQASDSWSTARERMVDEEIVAAGVDDPRVVAAMRSVPRHEFVAARQQTMAYFDMALPIGHGQTISPPYVVAYMTEKLELRPGDKVLEIGTGSGYQAAVLGRLVRDVYTIEIVEPLARKAERTLSRLGYSNVHTRIGDGFLGWPEEAPFDRILVTCSPEEVPSPLVDQLAEGGVMVIPLGERFQQVIHRLKKVGGQLEQQLLEPTFFVPMTGQAERARNILPSGTVEIVHGSFEETLASSDVPRGWYYVRGGGSREEPGVPDGTRCLVFANDLPGRSAHAMQAFGIDGRQTRHLVVSCWVRTVQVKPGAERSQRAGVFVEFYGEDRARIGNGQLGPWRGSFGWTAVRKTIDVPPAARLAVLGAGLFGATGTLGFDQVSVASAEQSVGETVRRDDSSRDHEPGIDPGKGAR